VSCSKQNQPHSAALGRCLGKKIKLFLQEFECFSGFVALKGKKVLNPRGCAISLFSAEETPISSDWASWAHWFCQLAKTKP